MIFWTGERTAIFQKFIKYGQNIVKYQESKIKFLFGISTQNLKERY